MSERSLVFRFLGRDEVSGTFSKIGKESENAGGHVSRLGSHLGGIAKTLGTGLAFGAAGAAAAGFTAIIKTGWDETKDYQTGLAQLNAGLKSTHDASGMSAQGMEDLASKIQDYSGQTDDSIVQTESLLLTFTNIHDAAGKNNDIFTQTTKVAADMAAKMGGDASTQAVRLGKALNDPIKGVSALAKVGVSFTDAQKKQITAMVKSGDTMGAQKVILGELNKEFGGSAKAAGETLPGQLTRLKRGFEDVSQNIVSSALPVLTKLVTVGFGAIQHAVPKIEAWFTQHLLPAFKAISTFITSNVLPVYQAVAKFLISNVVPAVAKLVAVVAGALKQALEHINQVIQAHRQQFESAFKVISKVAAFVLRTLVPVLSVTLRVAFKVLGVAIGLVITILANLFSWIGKVAHAFTSAWSAIRGATTSAVSFVSGKLHSLVDFFTGLPGRMARVGSGMFDFIKGAFRSAINFVIHGWNSLQFRIPGFSAGPVHFGGYTLGVPAIPYLWKGGTATSGGLAMVGERGPELIDMPKGASVIPLNRAGGGNTYININTGPMTREGAREIYTSLNSLYRESGGRMGIKPV